MPNATLVAVDNATPIGTAANPLFTGAGTGTAGTSTSNPVFTSPSALIPSNATAIGASSGNVTAAVATASLAAVAGKTTYISGFELTGAGATAASVVTGTITGLAGGTISFNVAVPAGAAVGITPLTIEFTPPLAASAQNTAIVVSFPSLGAGNTNSCVNAHGFQL